MLSSSASARRHIAALRERLDRASNCSTRPTGMSGAVLPALRGGRRSRAAVATLVVVGRDPAAPVLLLDLLEQLVRDRPCRRRRRCAASIAELHQLAIAIGERSLASASTRVLDPRRIGLVDRAERLARACGAARRSACGGVRGEHLGALGGLEVGQRRRERVGFRLLRPRAHDRRGGRAARASPSSLIALLATSSGVT